MDLDGAPEPTVTYEEGSLHNGGGGTNTAHAAKGNTIHPQDILALQDIDPVLNMKMNLVNNVCGSRFPPPLFPAYSCRF